MKIDMKKVLKMNKISVYIPLNDLQLLQDKLQMSKSEIVRTALKELLINIHTDLDIEILQNKYKY